MFFSRRKVRNNPLTGGWIRVVPDLAVEVVSPNDTAEKLSRKLRDYMDAGIPLVWVIYPGTRSGMAYRARTATPLLDKDAFDGEDILPCFRLPLGPFLDGISAQLAGDGEPA